MANQRNTDAGTSGKNQSWKDIQIPNRVAAVIILLVVAIIGLVFFLQKDKGDAALPVSTPQTQLSSQPSPDAAQVDVLPHSIRSFDSADVKNPFASDTLGDVYITGIVSNSNGKSTAIIETAGSSYVLSTGEAIPDSSWSVLDITASSVVFSNGSSQKTIPINSGAEVN